MISRNEAEELIALVRSIANDNFSVHQSKKGFDPEHHNLCAMYCEFDGGYPKQVFVSYSAMSAFSKGSIRRFSEEWGLEFVPDVAPHLQGTFACGGMGKFHTEPRLIHNMFFRPGFLENLRELTIITEIEVCTTCRRHTLDVFKQQYPNKTITVYDLSMNPGSGVGPQYKNPALQ